MSRMKALSQHVTLTQLAAAVLVAFVSTAGAAGITGKPYSSAVDDDGKLYVRYGRTPIVTTSYAGMFGRLPTGSLTYYITVNRGLRVEMTDENTEHPQMVMRNTGTRGVTMSRVVTLDSEHLELRHEISVPNGVAGSIDTGFTLNPELAYGARVTLWPPSGAEPSETALGVADSCLPYRANFRKIHFDSEWGRLAIEFETEEGFQAFGSLLNGARSPRSPSEWVQVLPLFAGTAEDAPTTTYRSVCRISFEPASGKPYLSPTRNLLYNSSFEDWSNPDLPDGWRRSPYALQETGAGIAPDEGTVYEGTRSLRWTLDSGALTHVMSRSNYAASTPIEAPCTFSVYLRSDPPGVKAALKCGSARAEVTAAAGWERFAVTATRGVGGQSLPVSVEKLSPGVLWLDAAQLEEAAEATPFVSRSRASVVGAAPFPADCMVKDLAELREHRPTLHGCGPDLSYYTSETTGRLIYDVDLDALRRETASLLVRLTGPAGELVCSRTFAPPVPRRVELEFSVGQLPLGISLASAALTGAGQETVSLDHKVRRLPPLEDGVEVKINRLTRCLVRAGQPYIPVGSDASSGLGRALECIEGQAANGFNHLHLWSGFYSHERTPNGRVPKLEPEMLQTILDRAHAAGMTVTVNLSHWLSINHFQQHRFTNRDLTDDDLIEAAVDTVRRVRQHPAVLTWHLCDEPNPAYCPPAWLERAYQAVEAADPYHPPEINVCVSGRQMLSFREASDLMSIDVYPVPQGHVGIVAPHTRFMRLADAWRPIRWWIQAWANVREPTAAEEVCMTYQALAEGTRFVLFYNYRPTSYAAWSALGRLASEIRELTPALIGQREDIGQTGSGPEQVVASLHRTASHVTIIAVNRDTVPVDAGFVVPAECAAGEAEVRFESRRVRCQDGVLKDRFAPMARHVYRFRR